MAFDASNTGIDVKLTNIAFGDGFKAPDGTEDRLVRERKRIKIGGGSRITADQVRIWGLWSSDTETGDIREIGIYAGTTLFAYYSRPEGTLISRKTAGGDFVFYYDWKLAEIPSNLITVVLDPDAALALAVMAVHEKDLMAHDHFLRRASVAQEAETFKWGGLAGGSTNVIELTLPFESLMTSYVPGQQFRFIAKFGNSGATSLRINDLELRSVRKYGNTGLVSGDIVKGSIYSVTFDGSNFQIEAGIGGSAETVTPEGDVFYVNSFTATDGQTSFEVPYNVGALMVFRGGDIVQPEHFEATDGSHVVFPTPSTAGQEVVVVTFRALAAANVYTKPQTYSRAEVGTLLADKQNVLGFTPVQQGGGVGQTTAKVRIGANSAGQLLAQVDNVALGQVWTAASFDPAKKANIGAFGTYTGSQELGVNDMGTVMIDATNGATITLPPTASVAGQDILIRRTDNSPTGLLYVYAFAGESIRMHLNLRAAGYPFTVLMGLGDWWHLRSDGAGGWWPIGRHDSTQLGQVSMVAKLSLNPGGYGLTDGGLYTRSAWPWLWDHAQQSGMLVTEAGRAGFEGCWTQGNGTTTFRIPESRGEFWRVLDEGRGVDVGRAAGSWAADQNKAHTHAPAAGGGFVVVPNVGTGGGNLVNGGLNAGYLSGPTASSGGAEARPRSIAYPGRIKLI